MLMLPKMVANSAVGAGTAMLLASLLHAYMSTAPCILLLNARRLQKKASLAMSTAGGSNTGSSGRDSKDAYNPVTHVTSPRTSSC